MAREASKKEVNHFIKVFSIAVPIVDTETSKQILQIKQKLVKNPNWLEAGQLAIFKAWTS